MLARCADALLLLLHADADTAGQQATEGRHSMVMQPVDITVLQHVAFT